MRPRTFGYAAGLALAVLLMGGAAQGQRLMGDVLTGKLISPRTGAWAWYDLTDTAAGKSYLVRLAIVGEEPVGNRTGYWLELEVAPIIGYRSVFKMLLTGPASNPKNVHKVIRREGQGEPEEVAPPAPEPGAPEPQEPARTLVGTEDVAIEDKTVSAEHYAIEGEKKAEVWLNEEVRPMGIVRMKSAEGELMLKSFGAGGVNARSVINEPLPGGRAGAEEPMKVEVRVDSKPQDGPPEAGKEPGP